MKGENAKLEKFKNAVFNDVDEIANTIIEQADKYREVEIDKIEKQEIKNSNKLIKAKTEEIEKTHKREIAKFSLDSRRNIIYKRNDIAQKMLDSVREMLIEFTKTKDYKDYLMNILKFNNEKYNLSGCQILIADCDNKFAQEIQNEYKCTCKQDNKVLIGGFIAIDVDRGIYIDETLEQKIAKQKSYIIENTQFQID